MNNKSIRNKKDVLERLDNFLTILDLNRHKLNNMTGLLITGGSSLLLIDDNAIATRDIDAYVVKEDNNIDWFYNSMLEPGLRYEINDQAAKDIPLLTKQIMMDKDYTLIETLYGFDIYVPSIETLIMCKLLAISDRNKAKDETDLDLLLNHNYSLEKLRELKNAWCSLYDSHWQRFEIKELNRVFDEYIK